MYYAALEAGGTKMVCAIGDEQKNIIDKVTIPTDTADVSVPKMIEYFRRYPVASLGIGTFGPVCVDKESSDYGRILRSPKKSWEGFNFYQTFSDALQCPVVVERVVLGGGVMENEFLFPMIRKYYAELLNGYIESPRVSDLENYIVPAGLHGEQGIIGAMNLI